MLSRHTILLRDVFVCDRGSPCQRFVFLGGARLASGGRHATTFSSSDNPAVRVPFLHETLTEIAHTIPRRPKKLVQATTQGVPVVAVAVPFGRPFIAVSRERCLCDGQRWTDECRTSGVDSTAHTAYPGGAHQGASVRGKDSVRLC